MQHWIPIVSLKSALTIPVFTIDCWSWIKGGSTKFKMSHQSVCFLPWPQNINVMNYLATHRVKQRKRITTNLYKAFGNLKYVTLQTVSWENIIIMIFVLFFLLFLWETIIQLSIQTDMQIYKLWLVFFICWLTWGKTHQKWHKLHY